MNHTIGVPTGSIQCSQPAPVKPARLRVVQHIPYAAPVAATIVEFMRGGFVPEFVKKLGARNLAYIDFTGASRSLFVLQTTGVTP